MDKLSEKIVNTLKSNTYNSVYINTLAKLPIVVTREGTFNDINGDTYPIPDYDLSNIIDDFKITPVQFLWRKCRINNVKKFHYDDTWYSHRYSVDYPEETFGILEISNLPFRPLDKLMNKKSFICRMDQLMFNGIMEPFMLFIDRKFVNWNAIDVVFDCDDIYLLLHGKEYNHYDLVNAEIMMVILPFKVGYVGHEPDDIWNKNYDMLCSFMQDSLHTNQNNKIEIEVPTMYSIYNKRGMIYNVGAWMYTQIYMNNLGLLSSDRINKLKRIILTRITYDAAGNIISSYNTKFNVFDNDSYDSKICDKICHCDFNYLKECAVFRFNNDGILDLENGENILANLDESMIVNIGEYSGSNNIILNYYTLNETIFRENILVFKSGLFEPECMIEPHGYNMFTIDNIDKKDKYTVILFKPSMIESIIKHSDNFVTKTYLMQNILNCIKYNKDTNIIKLISLANEPLNYKYSNTLLYEDNINNGLNAILNFNPLLLNDLTKTTIKSSIITGRIANSSLTYALGSENRRGLKIPRYKYKDHETYVIIFVNGELIENYNEMYAASNYFFLPVENDFGNGDVIEFLFFTYCDNNEIHFSITDNMISKLNTSNDPEFIKSELFKEYIKPEDIKIFAKYPEEIIIYKDLIEKNDDIAFNISYRNTNNDLLVFKDVIKNKSNEFTAVSSRKFIYERLYIDQECYRIKLGDRFRYCDNQKQYILFINGRRMEDDSFLITVPKYSRPFWGIYLYSRRIVGPNDRIEIFYVPEELYNINTDESPFIFGENGYIETDKNHIDVPYNSDFYLHFINGKKIPNNDIIPIDSHTVRLKSDTKSFLRLNINPIYRTTSSLITSYMKDDNLSRYDQMIKYIKDTFGYYELDKIFNTLTKMTDSEQDAIWLNIDNISIINEIVRDFWVSSGYNYNNKPFVYDYNLDEIIIKDNNGNYILPVLDATAEINIPKNNIRLLYLNIDKDTVYEIGSSIDNFAFSWEFSSPINRGTITLASQYVNGKSIDIRARNYIYASGVLPIKNNMSFYFQFNTMQNSIEKQIDIKFYNGIYYGTIDEDILQHYNNRRVISLDKIFAVIAKDKEIPSSAQLQLENESLEIIKKDNYIIYNLKFTEKLPDGLVDFVYDGVMAIYEDGTIYRDLIIAEDEISGIPNIENPDEFINMDNISIIQNYNKDELHNIMYSLNRVYQDDVTLDFESYKIGSNNYFVYACPKRLAYDENGRRLIRFTMPDINDPDVIEYGKDDHTTPIFTNGEFDEQNLLVKLDKCEMEFVEEFEYTNPSGYTETYVMWKTNGFFTRKYEDYEFNMNIKSEKDFVSIEEIPIISNESESIRIVNTASPTGLDINDNIVMIDTLLL